MLWMINTLVINPLFLLKKSRRELKT